MSNAIHSKTSMAERMLIGYARYFPIRRGKLRVVDALWKYAAANSSTQRIAQLQHGRLHMQVDITEQLQRQYYFVGTYLVEEDILNCWCELAKSARTILDIGAHRGIYSVAALAASPAATVHAFEPTPGIAAELRQTAELNGLRRLHVHEVAVLARSDEVQLVEYRGSDGFNGGMNYVTTDGPPVDNRTISVDAIRLDTFCAERSISQVDLMKIDVQGHESAVLSGAGTLLQEHRVRTIFLELNWALDASSICPARAVVAQLAEAGYLFANPRLPLRLRSAGDWLKRMSDVIAVHPEA